MDTHQVILEMPAAPAFASLARATAARMAAMGGLTLEGVEDLRLAVSEVYAALVATPGVSTVTITFSAPTTGLDPVRLQLAAQCPHGLPTEADLGVAWTLAKALVDDASWSQVEHGVVVDLAMSTRARSGAA